MADMVALFSNVGSHVPFFKKEHMHKAIPESLVSSKILSIFDLCQDYVHYLTFVSRFQCWAIGWPPSCCLLLWVYILAVSFCKNWQSVSYRWRWWLVPSGFLGRATSSTACMGAPLPMMSSTDTAIFRFYHFRLWLVFWVHVFLLFHFVFDRELSLYHAM